MKKTETIDWQKGQGLIPAIIQDADTLQVLMLGYMNQEALQTTLQTKKITFFSRSKNRLWQKGETSGHFLNLVNAQLDCDQDSLLFLVKPEGPACHLQTVSCFNDEKFLPLGFLMELNTIINHRYENPNATSYTSQLFQAGTQRAAQKVGEEGVEVALAAMAQQPKEIISEAADLIFHLLVLLRISNIKLAEVMQELQQRHTKSK